MEATSSFFLLFYFSVFSFCQNSQSFFMLLIQFLDFYLMIFFKSLIQSLSFFFFLYRDFSFFLSLLGNLSNKHSWFRRFATHLGTTNLLELLTILVDFLFKSLYFIVFLFFYSFKSISEIVSFFFNIFQSISCFIKKLGLVSYFSFEFIILNQSIVAFQLKF